MNKKLVLSVLSTAVVASMATSAFAAPKAGLYIGGNIDKFYSTDALLGLTGAAKTQFQSYVSQMVAAGQLAQVVYVDAAGNGANVDEILDAGSYEEAKKDPLKADDFEDSYTEIKADGTSAGTVEPKKEFPETELKVDSVSAINAKEVQIHFTKAVSAATVIAGGNLNNISVSPIGTAQAPGAIAAALSADGKTLTLTAGTFFKGQYAVTVPTAVTDANGNPIEAYTSILTVSDTERPTISNPTYEVNNEASFTFSEPLNVANAAALEGAMTITDASGASVSTSGLVTLAADKKSFTLNISGFTAGQNYTVTFVGLKDFAGNLISPNPVTKTVVNNVVDNVNPAVTSLVATKVGEMVITFSEKVKDQGAGLVGTYQVDGGAVNNITIGTNATVDSTGKVVTVTDPVNLTAGVKSVAIAGYKDLSGNTGTAFTKLLQFTADGTAPTVTSTSVQTISGTQYLVVNFNEEVAVGAGTGGNALAGTYVDANQVTRPFSTVIGKASLHDPNGTGHPTAIKIDLTGLAAGTYTATLQASTAVDTSANPVAATTVNFTLGSASDTGKPTITDGDSNPANGYTGIVVQGSEDTVTVHFDEPVTAATALNVANYKVEGQSVFSGAIFDGDQQSVKLTLAKNAINVTGLRNFTISNVADVAGNVMDPVTTQVNFVENVKPVITSAVLTAANQITVTFSENVNFTGTDDFTVTVDGAANAVTAETGSGTKQAVLTLTSAVTDLSKPIVLTVASGNDVTDTATPANKLATTGTINVTH